MVTIPAATVLGQVVLKTRSLAASLAFYTETIGFSVLKKEEGRAWLTVDGVEALIELEEHPDAVVLPERSTAGLYHFAILLPDRPSLSVLVRHLAEKRIPLGQADHLVSEAFYLSDPDGHGIEVYRDRPRSEWRRDTSGDFVMASDPIAMESFWAAGAGHSWNGLPKETIIGHIHLHTKDLDSAREFYVDGLGFEVVGDYKPMRALFISAGGYHHHIGLNVWAGVGAPPAPEHAVGLRYFTIILPDRESLLSQVEQLRSKGFSPVEKENGFAVIDPAGITVYLRA